MEWALFHELLHLVLADVAEAGRATHFRLGQEARALMDAALDYHIEQCVCRLERAFERVSLSGN